MTNATTILVLVTGVPFIVASLYHGLTNWRRPVSGPRASTIQWVFYVCCGAFAGSVAMLGWSTPSTTWHEVGGLIIPVATVHIIRVAMDHSVNDPAFQERRPIVRYVMDAFANFTVISLALFATETRNILLTGFSGLFGLMFILKELKYRLRDDVEMPHHSGSARRLDSTAKKKRDRRDFLGNFMKSYFYILIGFSILYACLAVVDPNSQTTIANEATGGAYPGLDALSFALRGAFLGSPSGNSTFLIILLGIEALVFIPLTLYTVGSVFRSR